MRMGKFKYSTKFFPLLPIRDTPGLLKIDRTKCFKVLRPAKSPDRKKH
jgi:hypothetical protein